MDELVASEDFQAASDEIKNYMLKILFSYADENGKTVVCENHGLMFDSASRNENIAALKDVGLSVADAIRIVGKQKEADELYPSNADSQADEMEKAWMFTRWVDEQGWTEEQRTAIAERFSYQKGQMQKLEAYTDFGMDEDTAMSIENAIDGLEPREGKESVSNTQRMAAIMNLGLDEQTLRNALRVRSGFSSETLEKRFEVLDEYGISSHIWIKAKEIVEQADLQPLDGSTSVSEMQEFAAIAESNLTEAGKAQAMISIAQSESTRDRIQLLMDYNVSTEAWAKLNMGKDSIDSNGSGSISQKELEQALDSYGGANDVGMLLFGYATPLTNSEKAVLWQLYNKSWKAYKNPFDRQIGQEIYNILNQK